MEPLIADLITYYDQEATSRADRPVGDDRSRWRDDFITRLKTERRSRIVEIGCGPGRDATAFDRGGLTVVGVDLSTEQLRLAADRHVKPVQASMFALPFRPDRFDGAWSMSVLVHVPDDRFDDTMNEICSSVVSGGLVGLGTWGGFDQEGPSDFDTIEPPRFFSFRSDDRLRTMLGRFGAILSFETVTFDVADGSHYQYVVLRIS